MIGRRASVAALFAALLLAGCGSQGDHHPRAGAGQHAMADGSVMSDQQMQDMAHQGMTPSTATRPTSTAAMICGDEIRTSVARTLGLAQAPEGLHSWSDRTYRCTYQFAGGDLRLSVKDLDTAPPGRAYYASLKARLPGARPIHGMQSFGFPAFETVTGDVVFLKDHKTLWVDASRLGRSDLPAGFSREDAAYAVAAAVIACWTE